MIGETVGTETIRGITFCIVKDTATGILVGHTHVGHRGTGAIYGAVSSGEDLPRLRQGIVGLLDDITSDLTEDGHAPDLVGLGWDTDNPPKAGAPETWVVHLERQTCGGHPASNPGAR
jgi:hypothetical protein